jgi:hypothetical protein
MVHFTALLAVLVFASPIALSHPLRRRQNSDDINLQNGLEAQKLNAAFADLKATDDCTNGEIACVEGELAQCRRGSWLTQSCLPSLQCFALPNFDEEGVTLGCTSAKTAAELIEATGATEDVDSSDNSTDINDNDVKTVTVTVTLPSDGETQTLSPSTATLTPADASNVVAGAVPTETPDAEDSDDDEGSTITLSGAATPQADPATAPSSTAAAGAGGNVGTTILLSGPTSSPGVQGGLAAPAPSATTINLNAPAAATPAPAAAAAPPAGPPAAGGYY